jgi:hypothetical protein
MRLQKPDSPTIPKTGASECNLVDFIEPTAYAVRRRLTPIAHGCSVNMRNTSTTCV